MRLPQDLLERPLFQYTKVDELLTCLGDRATAAHREAIRVLVDRGLPPVVSEEALAAMIGINPGIVWSFLNRSQKHYRSFHIEKGRGQREIFAPRVGLKIIQKWLSHHLAKAYAPPNHVFGFVPGRSHIDAANAHVGAHWAYSCDIENFFDTTPAQRVHGALIEIGYDDESATLVTKLCTLGGHLPQGSPASPIISNLCFRELDVQLASLAQTYTCTVSRYADDIVFSGSGSFPNGIERDAHRIFEGTPWRLAAAKELRQPLKGRIKVHGLLIKEDGVRLTKGYRNQLRAYEHIVKTKGSNAIRYSNLLGHLCYADFVAERSGRPGDRRTLMRGPAIAAATLINPDNLLVSDVELAVSQSNGSSHEERKSSSLLSVLKDWFRKLVS